MVVSYNWLQKFLPYPLPLNEVSKILTSIGLEVEAIERVEAVKGSLSGLVIGEVLTCTKHPNADKLNITTVNLGTAAPVQIVCGAANVATGQKVVVAPVGTTVYPTKGEPFLIKKAKIRGEESSGMICAEDEIGLGESHAGIMILPENAQPGILAKDYFKIPLPDDAIYIGLTPNRSDANSHIGVAKDICAYMSFHSGIDWSIPIQNLPDLNFKEISSAISINIVDQEACKRYSGICIENIKVGSSPEWLVARLKTIGVRSINNIVDITNYVLHETGQPLHAFDADTISGKIINIQFLPENTSFIGLDGKERKVKDTDLMICDEAGPLAIGGVFGGKDSGVSNNTTRIFIESAYFDPQTIRKTSMHHGLRTDAATHFEKGVDINAVIPALQKAVQLVLEIAAGTIASPLIDIYPAPLIENTVRVYFQYIRKLSGKNYSKSEVQKILQALGFVVVEISEEHIIIKVPSNKPDVSQPADIVEEILRIDGLDNIEIPKNLNISLLKAFPSDRNMKEKISVLLCGMGMQEIITNSIVNSKYYPGQTHLVKMLNSLSSELDTMRPSMLESGLEIINYNCNRKNFNLFFFEFGRIYKKDELKFIEDEILALWLTGDVNELNWAHTEKKISIYYVKGIIINLLQFSGIENFIVEYFENEIIWKWNDLQICRLILVSNQQLHIFDIKQSVFYVEFFWKNWLLACKQKIIQFREIPKFPSVERDLAIVVDKNLSYQSIQEATYEIKIESLKNFYVFDIFENDKLGVDKKSLTIKYIFQLSDRTLTEREVEEDMKKIISNYSQKLNILIRE